MSKKHLKVNRNTLIIDAIFGVGLCREVGGRYVQIIECVNQSDAVRMSVDIPPEFAQLQEMY